MTVFNSLGKVAKASNPFYITGKTLRTVNSKFTITAAAATDGDIYVLTGPLTTDSKIHRMMLPVGMPAFTSAIDNDIGFYYYKDDVLTAVDADILADGVTLAAALANIDLLSLNAALDKTKTIGDLLSLSPDNTYAGGLYLCLTINTKSTLTTGNLDLDIQIECPTS
jgi:hypothetical protein